MCVFVCYFLWILCATSLSYEVHRVLNGSFSSTILPDSSISAPPAGAPLRPPAGSSSRGLKIGLPVGGSILVVGVIAAGLFAWRMPIQRRRKRAAAAARRTTNELAMMDAPHRFTYKELAAATNNFSDAELLGSGGFGSVYRGFLREGGGAVAVKRISAGSRQGEREFLSEISTIGRLRHRNLVPLQGWCHEREELLLVYEYMPNGSLDKTLFGHTAEQGVFNWQRRYKVLCNVLSFLLPDLCQSMSSCRQHRLIFNPRLLPIQTRPSLPLAAPLSLGSPPSLLRLLCTVDRDTAIFSGELVEFGDCVK